MQSWLKNYTTKGGSLLVSGAYVGSDMTAPQDSTFVADVLKIKYIGKDEARSETVNGMGTKLSFHRQLNEQHYAAQHPDILQPTKGAITALAYADSYSAAVAYGGNDFRTFTMGFPFECIKSEAMQAAIMEGILNYLINNKQ